MPISDDELNELIYLHGSETATARALIELKDTRAAMAAAFTALDTREGDAHEILALALGIDLIRR